MKKFMILCLHRPDRSPSQRYRVEQYLEYFKQKGYEYDYSFLLNANDDKIYYTKGKYFSKAIILLKSIWKLFRETRRARKFDFVFVQREAFMLGSAFFEKKISKRTKLIFDFDDSIWMQTVSDGNKSLGFLKNGNKTAEIIKVSDLVIAGNRYLADYANRFSKKVVIIPTTIDTDKYQPVQARDSSSVCIGWTGSFSTLVHFAIAIPALKKIKEKYGDRVRFKIIGDPTYYCEALQTAAVAWRSETETQDLSEINIGIMPLPDDEWAKGKCGMKGLQYMASGIPALMSPVGVNTTIIQHGVNGYLPADEDEWVDILSMLIEDKELRKKIGAAGRQTVTQKYSVAAWKEKYIEYFNQLSKNN